ncbi:hypothetical protein FQN57_000400 [Myotisia sp. PD_48]|nr:hypothetical protein FQN57_000400 [Myotisia sp. PD_48]
MPSAATTPLINRKWNASSLMSAGRATSLLRFLHDFQLMGIDSTSPEEIKFAGVDLSVVALAISQRETGRICNSMDDAVAEGKCDLGIWKICEESVFPMLEQAKLNVAGLEARSPSPLRTPNLLGLTRNHRRARSQVAKTVSITTPETITSTDNIGTASTIDTKSGPLNVHPEVPLVLVVTKVYPATLLHALRLLQNKFPMSPTTTRLFEAVRGHGPISFHIGASREFCHEVIDFRWRVYNDLPFIVSFLRDMERNSIDFDQRTLDLVEKISSRRHLETSMPSCSDLRHPSIKNRNKPLGGGVKHSAWWDSAIVRKAYTELMACTDMMKDNIQKEQKSEQQHRRFWKEKYPI